MSHLDAAICPFMEREVEHAGAHTAEEIRAAVKAAWKRVTPEMCKRVARRVRDTTCRRSLIAKKGGNFFSE